MFLFEPPPVTRYDLRFTLANIPIRVHPFFWLIAILFGISLNDLFLLLLWVIIVFVSILIHELGHAFVMRLYGQPSYIVLHGAGGLTVPDAGWWGSRRANVLLGPGQEILISLAGPVAGFLFAALMMVVVAVAGGVVLWTPLFGLIPSFTAFFPTGSGLVNWIVMTLLGVNLFWGLVNLVPVYPLDGGSIARHLFAQADPVDGVRKSLWLSVIAGAIVAVVGLVLLRSIYMALLFGLLAFQSYQTVQGHAGRWS
ncbi:MAG TPA: site-2 protease family protein [Anaerolineae bacterium]|nr:site-2 protease family protein [Anaerolineae bacterium]